MSSVGYDISSRLNYTFGSHFIFYVITIILAVTFQKSLEIYHSVSPSARKPSLLPLVSLLIHSCLISFYFDLKLLYIVELYPSLFWSQSLFYYKYTYLGTPSFLFHGWRASGYWWNDKIKHILWGRHGWGVKCVFPSHFFQFHAI